MKEHFDHVRSDIVFKKPCEFRRLNRIDGQRLAVFICIPTGTGLYGVQVGPWKWPEYAELWRPKFCLFWLSHIKVSEKWHVLVDPCPTHRP